MLGWIVLVSSLLHGLPASLLAPSNVVSAIFLKCKSDPVTSLLGTFNGSFQLSGLSLVLALHAEVPCVVLFYLLPFLSTNHVVSLVAMCSISSHMLFTLQNLTEASLGELD